ncbi:helix-turn-helix domain-containing protein [Planktothrix sp. FACHB-1365]|nr:helix-turn-helix domain-containing protein [Planktothrix sp. FACHB-1365]
MKSRYRYRIYPTTQQKTLTISFINCQLRLFVRIKQ